MINKSLLFICTLLLVFIFQQPGKAAQNTEGTFLVASNSTNSPKKQRKSRYRRVLEVYADDKTQGSGNALFPTSTPEINIALNLGKSTSHTFVFVIVTDKNWKKTIFQIPVVVNTTTGTTITTLKRPMSGWKKGEYEVVVKDTEEHVLSTAFFSINDE